MEGVTATEVAICAHCNCNCMAKGVVYSAEIRDLNSCEKETYMAESHKLLYELMTVDMKEHNKFDGLTTVINKCYLCINEKIQL